jgi:opacity protein-like surface antigen
MKNSGKILAGAAVALSLSIVTPQASAAEVGVGVSLFGNESGYGVYLPIRFGNIIVEPELTVYKSSSDQTYPLAPTSNRNSDNQNLLLGTGVYLRHELAPSIEYYVGGRLGYTKYKYSTKYPSSPSSNYSNDEDGYYIGPVFGAEYFFNKHFSLGLDASLIYRSTSGDYKSSPSNSNSSDNTSWATETIAKLRVYF